MSPRSLPSNATREGTVAACERSLARLRTDRLDCYLLHWPGPRALEDTFAGFERLREQGKILSWGVSNFDVSDLDAAWKAGGEGRIACNQVLYHLQERAIEHAVLPWCEEHGITTVAYSPFGHGSFPGPYTSGYRVLGEIASSHGATARQVALRFLVRRPSLLTIPKASSPEYVADNAAAAALQLTKAELARIDAAFPLGSRPRRLPMLPPGAVDQGGRGAGPPGREAAGSHHGRRGNVQVARGGGQGRGRGDGSAEAEVVGRRSSVVNI